MAVTDSPPANPPHMAVMDSRRPIRRHGGDGLPPANPPHVAVMDSPPANPPHVAVMDSRRLIRRMWPSWIPRRPIRPIKSSRKEVEVCIVEK